MSVERVLIDTNVFVYAADEGSPQFPASSAFLEAVGRGSFVGCIAPQVLLEFVSVVTNPKRVATVRSAEEAWEAADSISASFTMLAPPTDLYARASRFGCSLGLKVQDVFDLALALTALGSGVTTIFSYDPKVFSRVPGITVRNPETIKT